MEGRNPLPQRRDRFCPGGGDGGVERFVGQSRLGEPTAHDFAAVLPAFPARVIGRFVEEHDRETSPSVRLEAAGLAGALLHVVGTAPRRREGGKDEGRFRLLRELLLGREEEVGDKGMGDEAGVTAFKSLDDLRISFFVADHMGPAGQTHRDRVIAVGDRETEIAGLAEGLGKRIAHRVAQRFRESGRACRTSAMRSAIVSIPTEKRTSASVIPTASRVSFGTLAWVIEAG